MKTSSKLLTKSLWTQYLRTHPYTYGQYTQSILFSTKKKKLPKKWKPTTSMFVPSKDNPGKYELSKHHNIKYMHDPFDGKEPQDTQSDEPSIIQQIETALEEDVDKEESEDLRFLLNYRWIIVSLLGMVIVLMGGFCLGFTRIKYSDMTDDEKDKNKHKEKQQNNTLLQYVSALKADESIVRNRHKAIAQIIYDLSRNATDCVMIDNNARFKNKTERETMYINKEITQDIEGVEQQMFNDVMGTKWTQIDLSEFEIDDIADAHWNFSQYIDDIRGNDMRLQFLPPLDTFRYGQGKKKKLMWIYSKKHLEWFQVVISFNDSLQSLEKLNFVAIRLRFKEFFCYPLLNDDGTANTKKWLIEKTKNEPRIEHLRRLHRHKEYFIKKFYHGVDPAKYELDVDDGICEYYGRNIFEEKEMDERKEEKKESENKDIADEELVKLVNSLEARLERRRLQQASTVTPNS